MYRVLVVDKSPITLSGYRCVFSAQTSFQVCAFAQNSDEALAAAKTDHPHLAIVDVTPGTKGMRLLENLRVSGIMPRVLAVSDLIHPFLLYRCLDCRAQGLISAESSVNRFIEAITTIANGGAFLDDRVSRHIVAQLSSTQGRLQSPVKALSERQLEIFRLVGTGLKSSQIAEGLGVVEKTVEKHLICKKLQLVSSFELKYSASVYFGCEEEEDASSQLLTATEAWQ